MIRSAQKIRMVKISEIYPNPYQARRSFNKKTLDELAMSIKENGILSPLILRGALGGYEIICGQRRFRAAIIAGFKEVPAIIVKANDAKCALITVAENVQRENLSVFEEAESYYNLMAYHRIKKDRLSQILSLDYGYINEKVRILSLSDKVRYKAEESGLCEKFSRELLKIHDEEKQLEIIEKAVAEDLSFSDFAKEVKEELKKMSGAVKERKRKTVIRKNAEEEMPIFINTVKKTVELLKKNGAKVDFIQKEDENTSEFILKIHKRD